VAGDTGGLGPTTLTASPRRGSTRVQALSDAAPQLDYCDHTIVAHELSMQLARTLELVPVFPNRVHPVVDVAFLTPKRIDGTATPAPSPAPGRWWPDPVRFRIGPRT
jgi:hypothetical protein